MFMNLFLFLVQFYAPGNPPKKYQTKLISFYYIFRVPVAKQWSVFSCVPSSYIIDLLYCTQVYRCQNTPALLICPIRAVFSLFECCTVTSPVCWSSKLPWEGPLLWPRLSAICCSRGTSTEVSHDRDCRSPGRSSSLSWEGSVVRSLRGRNERRSRGWGEGDRIEQGLTRLSAPTHVNRQWNLNTNTWRENFVLTKSDPL